MKRHFLSAICTLALLAFVGQNLSAQQETPTPSKHDNVIIIQKTQNDDGSWTVKKKSIQKGQSADAYLKEVDLDGDLEKVSEIIIKTNGDGNALNEEAETIMMIRTGSNKTEIKWDGSAADFMHKGPHLAELALIGDEMPTQKAFLGIYPETNENGGVLVTDIVPGSGAAAAGLRSGDVITVLDGKTLATNADLSSALASLQPADVVSVTFLREGQSMTTTAELTGKKRERQFQYHFNGNTDFHYSYERNPCEVFIGVQIGSWDEAQKGVGVSGIIAGWPAEAAGLQAGDRIVSMDGVPINTHNELVVERDKHKAGEYFTIGYVRDGKEGKVKAQFKTCPGQEVPQAVVEEQLVEQPTVPSFNNSLELEELNAYPNPTYGDLEP